MENKGNEKWTQNFPCLEHKCKADLVVIESIPRGMDNYWA